MRKIGIKKFIDRFTVVVQQLNDIDWQLSNCTGPEIDDIYLHIKKFRLEKRYNNFRNLIQYHVFK